MMCDGLMANGKKNIRNMHKKRNKQKAHKNI